MKPSHLSTPRTLADTSFTTGYGQGSKRNPDKPVLIVGLICFVLLVIFMAVGWVQ